VKSSDRINSFALVTGASSGIGLQYATQLARDYRYNLLLVSNEKEKLEQIAETLSQTYGVKAVPYYKELSELTAAEEVYDFAKENDMEVEVLVNNAGMLIFYPLCNTPTKKIETLLMLHVVTMTKLCQLFGADMCARRRGYVLNMSSMSAWMTMPGIQCYNASKSYVLNFSKSLWYEFKPHGIRVIAITPGAINTPFFNLSDKMRKLLLTFRISMQPEVLVRKALKKLFHSNKKTYLPGAWNYIIVPIISHLPNWLVFAVMKKLKQFRR